MQDVLYRMSQGLLVSGGGRMNKEVLQEFKIFCDWCYKYGLANCDECKMKLDDVLKI